VHNPTSPSPKTAPPPPGASHTIKSTTKRSPKSPKKKTKKVVESEEITEGRKMTAITTGDFLTEITCRWTIHMNILKGSSFES
jgi:hypothetical protein